MNEEEKRLPDWWPENPYPIDIFTLDDTDVYVKAVPDKRLRTAISGMLGRKFWQIASDAIWKEVQEVLAEKDQEVGITDSFLLQKGTKMDKVNSIIILEKLMEIVDRQINRLENQVNELESLRSEITVVHTRLSENEDGES